MAAKEVTEHPAYESWVPVFRGQVEFTRIEPDAEAVGALIDLDAVQVGRRKMTAALGASLLMAPALGIASGLLQRGALLFQELGVTKGEVLFFVLSWLVGHREEPGLGLDMDGHWPLPSNQ